VHCVGVFLNVLKETLYWFFKNEVHLVGGETLINFGGSNIQSSPVITTSVYATSRI
jgi:hypothetical protein